MHDTQIATTDECSGMIQGIMPPFAKKLAVIRDLDQMFLELGNILNHHIAAEPTRTVSLNTSQTNTAELVEDLESCADLVQSIRSDLSLIEFKVSIPFPDGLHDASVAVAIQCVIQPGYPSTAPIFQSFDVPSDAIPPPSTAPTDPTLAPLYCRIVSYCQSLSRFVPLWAELAHLARNARLLSTEFATTRPLAATWRSIDLGEYAHLELPLSVTDPRGSALLRDYVQIFGNETIAGPLRVKWQANVSTKWKSNVSVAENIKAVLERDLPLPPHGQDGLDVKANSDDDQVCAICYEDIGDISLAKIKCSCKQQYHLQCLESMYVRQMAMVVIGKRTGKCPLCNVPLPIPAS
ncbi:hypothetical protein BCR44DRAFT_1441300 [Catenaria anguillulae PL171]|uniref:RING-type domain-containing protein n=1 Tax=Catenaria anguillulae PL171 TaxID=765915 RepID=A0A1Y2HDY2_9FUNG|nr:hypothetical protein BCR44DRAFT_1441300 [Catenaria anguillulae PL171]